MPGYYHSYIKEMEEEERVGTASSYRLSLRSLLGYHITGPADESRGS